MKSIRPHFDTDFMNASGDMMKIILYDDMNVLYILHCYSIP